MKLFVAGLPYDLYDDELVEIFEKFGKLVSAKVAIDKNTGKSRGFGFVEMESDDDARDCIEHLNDISLGKKPLVVKEATDQAGGGFGGENRSGGFNKGNYNRDSSGGYNKGGGYNKRDDDRNFKPRNRF